MAEINIEGQKIVMDDEIARDDELLRAALAPSWPDAKTATFTRTGGTDGKPLVVRVSKKAGTKGALIERLFDAPDEENPAIVMSRRIAELHSSGQLNQAQIETLMPEIAAAADQGERDIDATGVVVRSLRRALVISGNDVPLGF